MASLGCGVKCCAEGVLARERAGYAHKGHLRGLLEPAQAGLVWVARPFTGRARTLLMPCILIRISLTPEGEQSTLMGSNVEVRSYSDDLRSTASII